MYWWETDWKSRISVPWRFISISAVSYICLDFHRTFSFDEIFPLTPSQKPPIKLFRSDYSELNRNAISLSTYVPRTSLCVLSIKYLCKILTSARLPGKIFVEKRPTPKFVKDTLKLFFDGALWKIERGARRNAGGGTHTRARATELVDRIGFRIECTQRRTRARHTPTAYARCMITTALRSDGQGAPGSRCMQTYCASVNEIWNVNAWMRRKRPDDGRQREEMEIEIADPPLSTSLSISRDLHRE